MKRIPSISEEQKKEIIELYNQGYLISEIINRFNLEMTRHNFYYFLKKNNVIISRKLRINRNISGQVFGYLTVVKMVRNENSTKCHPWRAICKCNNCGRENVDINPQSLLRGDTTSCGCSRDWCVKITGKNSTSYRGYEELGGTYWSKIRKRANDCGQLFDITIEFAWDLYLKQNRKCAISGLPIEFNSRCKKNPKPTASLDRIDSTKGYVVDNVQWVHKHVNVMKNAYEQNYFISICKLIAENNQ